VVPFDSIPDSTKLAFLAAEDAHFYEHEGLNYLGVLRALWANLRAGRTVQGGSTITQQVVKNILLDTRRTYRRKVRETILSRRLEQHLTKNEIFGLYLNHIYLGHGRYGLEEAARYYFGKHASELDEAESALLAGLVASPERFSPRRSPERALARRAYVLSQMKAKGFVTDDFYAKLSKAPLLLAPEIDSQSGLSPEAVAVARRELLRVQKQRGGQGCVPASPIPIIERIAVGVVKTLDAAWRESTSSCLCGSNPPSR
jgi:penicillin-binding protein 1A